MLHPHRIEGRVFRGRWSLARGAIFLLCLMLSLAGCGGGGDDDDAAPAAATLPPVTVTETQNETLDDSGGDVALTITNGTRFTLAVPIGALAEEQNIRLTSRPTSAGQYFNLLLEPAGLLFQDGAQVTLTITLPDGITLPETGGIAYAGAPVPFEVLDDGSLQIVLSSFYQAPPVVAVASGLRAQSVRAAAATSLCGDAASAISIEADAVVAVNLVEIELYGHCMVGAVQQLAANGEYADAVRAAAATAALLQAVGQQGNEGESAAQSFIAEASGIACTALRERLDTAEATTVSTMGSLYEVIKPILFWQQVVDQLGATCPDVEPTEYTSVIDSKVTEALEYYSNAGSDIDNTSGDEYADAIEEANASNELLDEIRALQPGTGIQNVLDEQIVERAQSGLLDAILHAPFTACRDSGNYAELINLAETLGYTDSVRTAAQYCGTTLNAESFDSNSDELDSLEQELGGHLAAQEIQVVSTGELIVSTNGRVTLNGPIRALGCPVNSNGGTENLEIRFNNVVVQTLSSAPYLSSTLQLNMSQLLLAADIDPDDFSSGTLTLVRTGSPCNGSWGNNPQPLLTVTLTATCVPQEGQDFCYTPVEIPGSASIYSYELRSLNDRGEVLFIDGSTTACSSYTADADDAPCGGIWRKGQVRMLPNRFAPGGMSNDGTTAGTRMTGSAVHYPAVVTSGSTTSISLATPIPPFNGDPPSATNYGIETISPNGRVTYSMVRGGYSYSRQEYGFCAQNNPDSAPYCWRERFYETSGPNYGAATQIHSSELPGGDGRTFLLFDNDEHGRGGSFGLYFSNNYFVSFNFTQGDSEYQLHMVDRNDVRLVYDRNNGDFELRDSSITLPTGYQPYVLGTNGHGYMCSEYSDTDPRSVRLFNTNDNSVGDAFEQTLEFEINGQTAYAYIECYQDQRGERSIDGLGRILVNASSDNIPRLRGVILTPPGVVLP